MNDTAMLIRREALQKNLIKAVFKLLEQVILWISVAVIVMLAVPAGILGLMIMGIWHLADHILAKLEGRSDGK